MNERIKDIIGQNCVGEYYAGILCWRFSESQLEKFAELIVRECLNQCYNRGMNDGLYAGQLQAASYIEEHFGVDKK